MKPLLKRGLLQKNLLLTSVVVGSKFKDILLLKTSAYIELSSGKKKNRTEQKKLSQNCM